MFNHFSFMFPLFSFYQFFGPKNEDKDQSKIEELMPELVEMVLGHVDRVGLVACRFVCTTWMRTTPWHEDEDRSAQFKLPLG
jgi:hypothetical protein